MFVPIYDDNPLRAIRWPIVTIALILINVAVYVLELTPQGQVAAASFAVVPKELFQVSIFGGPANGLRDALAMPESYTLLTYMFLHGDPFHLAGNMLFLWVFGDNIEDAMGHLKFLVFYLLCGVGGALAHAVLCIAGPRRGPGPAHRRQRRRCRRDRGLSDAAPACARLGPGLPLHSAADHGHVRARRLGPDPVRHAAHP